MRCAGFNYDVILYCITQRVQTRIKHNFNNRFNVIIMTQEEFNNLSLEQQIEALKRIEVVGVPTCDCNCGCNGQNSSSSGKVNREEPDPSLAQAAFSSLRWRTRRITREEIQEHAVVWSSTNPFITDDSTMSVYELYMYMNRETFTQVGFTADQMLFLALLVDAERRRVKVSLDELRTRVRALELRVEQEHPSQPETNG